MFDLSKEFGEFYNDYTILPRDTQSDLRDKKTINIERLESGLNELNDENKTSYYIYDTKEQGSIAMSTVVQNDNKDYDIDVAVIFEEDNIGEDMGSTAIKRIVEKALKKKCSNFKKEPEALTNCVRIEYAEGYHIDFAVYKKTSDGTYYHAGSSWQERDPMAINDWFLDAVKDKGDNLRSVVRLSKMFCKSRDNWLMPGGLIQSVLCNECFVDCERLDECFYYTMTNILNRLETSIEVFNPTDETKSLLLKQNDEDKMNNWKQRLRDKLGSLNIVKKSNCTKKQACSAWYKFFNHDFWMYSKSESAINSYANVIKEYNSAEAKKYELKEKRTEQFIEELFLVDIQYSLEIDCDVKGKMKIGTRTKEISQSLNYLLENKLLVSVGKKLVFKIKDTDISGELGSYDIYWKIKNNGQEAYKRDHFRGQIVKTNDDKHLEKAEFKGTHYVECYIIKNGVCVAKDRIDVPIE